MARADATLATMVARLRDLSDADRAAVLARLSPEARARATGLIGGVPATSPYAPDIAARIAALPDDPAMTPATRDVLARMADAPRAISPARSVSLLDRVLGRHGGR